MASEIEVEPNWCYGFEKINTESIFELQMKIFQRVKVIRIRLKVGKIFGYHRIFYGTQKIQFVPQMKILNLVKIHKNEAR